MTEQSRTDVNSLRMGSNAKPSLKLAETDRRSPSWLHASMPHAEWYIAEPSSLKHLADGSSIDVHPELGDKLTDGGTMGETLLAQNLSGDQWRLRRSFPTQSTARLWKLQSVRDSRRLLSKELRTRAASRLTRCILHDLRNPMNAASLHADMLAHITSRPDLQTQCERIVSSTKTIKERLRALNYRLGTTLAFWLSGSHLDDIEEPASTQRLDDMLRLLSAHFAIHDFRLEVANLAMLDLYQTRTTAENLEIALLTILLQACDEASIQSQSTADQHTVLLRVDEIPSAGNRSLRLIVDLHTELSANGFGPDLDIADCSGLIASLSLLLDGDGIDISANESKVTFLLPGRTGPGS